MDNLYRIKMTELNMVKERKRDAETERQGKREIDREKGKKPKVK